LAFVVSGGAFTFESCGKDLAYINYRQIGRMSIIGIDFGSHTASFAIWHADKNDIEVIADDLGSRTIPCAVAFRNDEIITGQSALSQQHKNIHNTFDDVRSLIFNTDVESVHVPALDKEISVQELTSHFFRNLHNQIKQQVGKIVRDCVLSVPMTLDENAQKRIIDAAQAGGIRVKSFISDDIATLMAYGLDDVTGPTSNTLIVDIGWSRTAISIYKVSGGLFFPLASMNTKDACGKVFVHLFADWCAKDFQKKYKIPCLESSKSMMRLRRECEQAMKSLSTGQEAMIDIDSLCEGQDYSVKITRARFEDIIGTPFMQLRAAISCTLAAAGLEAVAIGHVCMSGGVSAMPKVQSVLKTMLPNAHFLRGRFESSETQCLGAGLHGKYLLQQVS
jgi:heat shock protein 1/8